MKAKRAGYKIIQVKINGDPVEAAEKIAEVRSLLDDNETLLIDANTGGFYRGFHKMHNNDNIDDVDINVNFVFPYLCSFLLYCHHFMLINVKLDITGFKSIIF